MINICAVMEPAAPIHQSPNAPVVITGANSAVGIAILRAAVSAATPTMVAAVRSENGAEQVRRLVGATIPVTCISYRDRENLEQVFRGASAVIHLPGVLIERPGSSYEQANVATTRSVVEAAKRSGVPKLVLVSAIGADENSANRYWRTKGEAETLVRSSGLPYTVLRAPLLLGTGTAGATALAGHVHRSSTFLISGGHTMHQPLDVQDCARAALLASRPGVADNRTLDLVGPVALSERDMVARAASLLNRRVRVRSVPRAWVSLAAAFRELARKPGLSRDALAVITADTCVDPAPASVALGLKLSDFDETIRRSVDTNR